MLGKGQQLESETRFRRALQATRCQPPPLAVPPPTFRMLSGTDHEQFTVMPFQLRKSWIWQEETCPRGQLEGAEEEVGSAECRLQPNVGGRANDTPHPGQGHNSVLHTSAPVPVLWHSTPALLLQKATGRWSTPRMISWWRIRLCWSGERI